MNISIRRYRAMTALMLSMLLSINAVALESEMNIWINQQDMTDDNLAIATMTMSDGNVSHNVIGRLSPDGVAADKNTQFEIGSITKAFTNMLLAEMVAANKVGYDTTIAELLGDAFAPKNPAIADITLLALATHTSGLTRLPSNLMSSDPLDPYKDYDDEKLLQAINGARDKQKLGNQYAYSNFGVGLLGNVLGRVHGGGYAAAMNEYVIEPLTLRQTGMFNNDNQVAGFRDGDVVPTWTMTDALAGAGALRGSSSDFEVLAKTLLTKTSPLGHALSDDLEVVTTSSDGFGITRVWHVDYAGDQPIYWHNGGTGGFWSFFGFRPDTDQAVAIFVSGNTNPTNAGLKLLGADESKPTGASIDPQLLGQYQLTSTFGIGIVEQSGQLMAQATGQPAFALNDAGDDWYSLTAIDASIHFVRDSGKITGLELAQGGVLQPAKKTANAASSASQAEVTLAAEEFTQFEGSYALSAAATFTIRRREGGLEAKITGQAFYPIFAKGDDVFFYKIVAAELHFERDESGAVNALVLHQGGITQRAEKK